MGNKGWERQIRTTILVVVEGETEEAFCLYLKRTLSRGKAHVVVENARGGSPQSILETAEKLLRYTDYDHRFVVLDADKKLCQVCQKIIEDHKIKCIQPDPCIEGWFLKLMEKQCPGTSKDCKRLFEKVGLSAKDKVEADNYAQLFPLESFDKLAQDPIFAKLRDVFTNKIR